MKVPVQIAFRGFEGTAALEADVRERVERLERYSQDVVACRVEIERLDRHAQQGQPYVVRLAVTLPGHELVVNQQPDENLQVALRDAFDAMRRQVEDRMRRLHDPHQAEGAERRRSGTA